MSQDKPTLFEIETNLRDAIDQVAFCSAEQEEETQQLAMEVIDHYLSTAEEKRDRVAFFLHHAESEAEFLEAQATELLRKADRIRKATFRLRGYVLKVMEFMNVPELKGRTSRFCRVLNPSHVEIVGDNLIPDEYIRTHVTKTPDKIALSKALKAGEQIPGAKLVPGQYRLEIK